MTYAYFYLVGQNITYLSTTWKVSLPIILLIGLIAAFSSSFTDYTIVGLLWGWASVAYIVETKVQVDTTLYQFNKNPSTHFQCVILALEIIGFIAMSLALLVDDGSVWIWMLIISAHGLYVFVLFVVNKASKKIESPLLALRYYFIYLMILAMTDSYFVVLSMIVHDRRQNLVGIIVATLLSQATIYFLSNYDLDKLLTPWQYDSESLTTPSQMPSNTE